MKAPQNPLQNMARIAGGSFYMGSDKHYPEERPRRKVTVDAFEIDRCAVSNADFARFVDATNYKTTAEIAIDPRSAPGMPPDYFAPGSLVFRMTKGPVDLRDFRQWWAFVPGASWKNPEGPGSTLEGRENHPVVHVSLYDALAYADWTKKSLPNEAEWEFAANGGAETVYPWGDALEPDGQPQANTWQGNFPWQNQRTDEAPFSMPIDAYHPNSYGLFNMIGNVWEWTQDKFAAPIGATSRCCTPPAEGENFVVKGGSFLCAPSYCQRYRPAARSPQEARSSTSHLGFRCVRR